MLTRKILRRVLNPVLSVWWKFYSRFPHTYRYNSLVLKLLPSVFHPALFLSTKVFLEYLNREDLRNKKVWELGAGSGLISMVCAQKGASVLATDINTVAIEGLKKNLVTNHLEDKVRILHSDLFESVAPEIFDFILINPPYYPVNAQNEAQMAFYCGENFEYFTRLFQGIGNYVLPESRVLMILSEDCEITIIGSIAAQYGWKMEETFRKRVTGEWNMIYRILKRK